MAPSILDPSMNPKESDMRLVLLLGVLLAPLALAGCAIPGPQASGAYAWQQPYTIGQGVRWHDDVCVEC
jgi:hypothetical protein